MSEVFADTWSWLKLDNLDKPNEEDEIAACEHPFDILLKDEYGYWNCMCGATGNLVGDYNGKLRFSIPRQKQTRQQRRTWERKVMKEFVKSQKRKLRDPNQKITT